MTVLLLTFVISVTLTVLVMRWFFQRFIARWAERMIVLAKEGDNQACGIAASLHELTCVEEALKKGGPKGLRCYLDHRADELGALGAEIGSRVS